MKVFLTPTQLKDRTCQYRNLMVLPSKNFQLNGEIRYEVDNQMLNFVAVARSTKTNVTA
jgi:hypothetical protein